MPPALTSDAPPISEIVLYDLPETSTLDVYWRVIGAAMFRKRFQYRLKRLFDLVVACTLLAVLSPVLLLVAALVKLTSRGPIVYRQQRLMKDGLEFGLFKFRTMVVGAEGMMDKVFHLNEANGPLFKVRRDPRITRVGRILRATFLDELPQLINVVRGEMSLVGPRPCLAREISEIESHVIFRFAVPQGITGPWQTNGHHRLTFEQQLEVERRYIESWSFAKDLNILLRTIPLILTRGGA